MSQPLPPWQEWTPSQERIRSFVIDYRKRYGQVPTRRVIHQATGLASRSYIDRVMVKIRKRGDLA